MAESREREREGELTVLPPAVQRKKNKSMNSSPASGMCYKQERFAIKGCPLLKLEQKCHIAENTEIISNWSEEKFSNKEK